MTSSSCDRGVNPPICDSATFRFESAEAMAARFESCADGQCLYSRHSNPTTEALAEAVAAMEGAEAGLTTASGISAIACTLLHLCNAGDEIVSCRMVYGGTYALLKNLLSRWGIQTRFVDLENLVQVDEALNPRTRVVFCESVSNPLLQVADLPGLAQMARRIGAKLVVDNTFAPTLIRPLDHGADVVVHSLTKFANGASDGIAGAIVGERGLVEAMRNVNEGAAMLLGPVLDPLRAASVRKNMMTLPLRMRKHGENALALATALEDEAIPVYYPGLSSHLHHRRFVELAAPGRGAGGMVAFDAGSSERAQWMIRRMQELGAGSIAVSLGYYRTLFSLPGSSTSSEIPEAERSAMKLTPGLIRLSAGLDDDFLPTIEAILQSWRESGVCSAHGRADRGRDHGKQERLRDHAAVRGRTSRVRRAA